MRQLVLGLAVLAIAGCASVESSRNALATAKVCCASLADLPFKPMQHGEPQELEIDGSSPVFEFAEGRSFFAAFMLPSAPAATSLEFMTGLNGFWLPSATVFMPSFTFLDAAKRPIATIVEFPITQGAKLFEPSFGSSSFWSGYVGIPKDARYVVIYASARRFGQTITHSQRDSGTMFMAGNVPIFVPGRGYVTHQIPYEGTGSVKLRLR